MKNKMNLFPSFVNGKNRINSTIDKKLKLKKRSAKKDMNNKI
jgi:hypothetical protein